MIVRHIWMLLKETLVLMARNRERMLLETESCASSKRCTFGVGGARGGSLMFAASGVFTRLGALQSPKPSVAVGTLVGHFPAVVFTHVVFPEGVQIVGYCTFIPA